jgi:hypothetical protein
MCSRWDILCQTMYYPGVLNHVFGVSLSTIALQEVRSVEIRWIFATLNCELLSPRGPQFHCTKEAQGLCFSNSVSRCPVEQRDSSRGPLNSHAYQEADGSRKAQSSFRSVEHSDTMEPMRACFSRPQFRTHKVIYRRYAGLFFSMCVDVTDNELAYLESIHLFVEILDHFFSNVCELDLVFNFHKVRRPAPPVVSFLSSYFHPCDYQCVL